MVNYLKHMAPIAIGVACNSLIIPESVLLNMLISSEVETKVFI
jgi:hypothetical protein